MHCLHSNWNQMMILMKKMVVLIEILRMLGMMWFLPLSMALRLKAHQVCLVW